MGTKSCWTLVPHTASGGCAPSLSLSKMLQCHLQSEIREENPFTRQPCPKEASQERLEWSEGAPGKAAPPPWTHPESLLGTHGHSKAFLALLSWDCAQGGWGWWVPIPGGAQAKLDKVWRCHWMGFEVPPNPNQSGILWTHKAWGTDQAPPKLSLKTPSTGKKAILTLTAAFITEKKQVHLVLHPDFRAEKEVLMLKDTGK